MNWRWNLISTASPWHKRFRTGYVQLVGDGVQLAVEQVPVAVQGEGSRWHGRASTALP